VKRALLETFVAFAEKIGSRIIAEGIETETELTTLLSIGVHYGQGYYLARPVFPKLEQLPARNWVRHRRGQVSIGGSTCSIPIRELVQLDACVPPLALVSEVKTMRDRNNEPSQAVAVVQEKRPVGLIMSHHLDRALSMQYGMSLYYQRDVSKIMDPAPVVVEGGTPVEEVARLAMSREKRKIYDNIVVTENGEYYGLVSVQKMLDTLATVQVRMAKGANPLTGLPGNVAIEQRMEELLQREELFSLIYADLDNFKVYNDAYGFKSGDDVLLLQARVLSRAARRYGGPGAFVGHVGGDDFVLITTPDRAEAVCNSVTRLFGRCILAAYDARDRQRGYIDGKDRDGAPRRFPLVSISLAIVDCLGPCQLADIVRRAAEMKKFAKSKPGNVYVRDRRIRPDASVSTQPLACSAS